jgi:hypothetical protein
VHLDHAVTLAQAADCRLVVLCSRQARADEVSELLAARSFSQGVVIDMPSSYGHRWLDFATSRPDEISRLPEPSATRDSDLSTKRNLGLLLARMVGWDRVFFMDDDIRDISLPHLRRTASMLGQQYYTVGMRVSDFPDNSVVCHAHRETGESQDVFVSGSVLAIDCTAPIGFFPDIYNEDWLFFYNDTVERRLAWSGIYATQLRYDPFDDPRRAAGQEFGDVLAEGLYALLHNRRNAAYATRDYWVDFLEARRGFLDDISARADKARPEVRQKMLASVAAARECSMQIEPALCEHYVKLWRNDLGSWEQTLKETPRLSSVTEALSQLGLTSAPEPVPISSGAMVNPSDDKAALAWLAALANVHQMERLRRTLARSANRAVSIPANHGRKLAAVAYSSQGKKKLAAAGAIVALFLAIKGLT